MIRFIPFVLASGAVHAVLCCLCGSLLLSKTGSVGLEHGLEQRTCVTVVAQEEVRAQAESPARQDSVASQAAEPMRKEEEETPEEQPEKRLEKEVVTEPEQATPSPDALVHEEDEIGPDLLIMAHATEKPASALVDRGGEMSPQDDKGESLEAKEKTSEDNGSATEKEHTRNRYGQESSVASVAQSASRESQFRAARGKDLANFRDSLVAAIRQVSYFPKKALRKRQHGETTVRFTEGRNGSVSCLTVVHSSGSKLLDEAAVNIIGNAAKDFPPIPASISRDSPNYVVPIVFKKRKSK